MSPPGRCLWPARIEYAAANKDSEGNIQKNDWGEPVKLNTSFVSPIAKEE